MAYTVTTCYPAVCRHTKSPLAREAILTFMCERAYMHHHGVPVINGESIVDILITFSRVPHLHAVFCELLSVCERHMHQFDDLRGTLASAADWEQWMDDL